MGLFISATPNINGNPQIFGSDSYQIGEGEDIVANPLVHRVVVERSASQILIEVTPANTEKTVDVSATASANAGFLSNIASNTGLNCSFDSANKKFAFTGDSITTNRGLFYQDAFFVDTSGTDSIYGSFTFVFDDSTSEQHRIFITSNEAVFQIKQDACSNKLTLTYQDALYDYQNPLDDWGAIDKGVIKYEYSLDFGNTWILIEEETATLNSVSKTFNQAYQNMMFRATRTIRDEIENIIYESISNAFTALGDGHVTGSVPFTVYDMTECIPTLSGTLSDLYCGCTTIDVIDTTSYQNRYKWFVGVFTRAVIDGTPYYKGPEPGNFLNPERDNRWAIEIPFNGNYTFKLVSIFIYSEETNYNSNDWVYNPKDGEVYVSLLPDNTGNVFSDLGNWRKWNPVTDLETVFTKTTNTVAGTYSQVTLTKNVTCNTETSVQVKNKLSCKSTCSAVVFDDVTCEFDFAKKPYGYGLPNYRRDAYANVYFLINNKSDGTILSYLPAAYNYLSSMAVLFDIPKDGWYRLYMYQVERYDELKVYYKDNIVFVEDENVFYKSLVDNNLFGLDNNLAWKGISSWDEFKGNSTITEWSWDYVLKCNSVKTINSIGYGVIAEKCNNSCQDELLKKYNLLNIYLNAACEAEQLFDYESAQCFLESIPKNCAPYKGITKGCAGC